MLLSSFNLIIEFTFLIFFLCFSLLNNPTSFNLFIGRVVWTKTWVFGELFLITLAILTILLPTYSGEGVEGELLYKSFIPINKKTALGLK